MPRSVNQKCRSEVSVKSVAQKCQSKVSLRSVEQNCCLEVSIRIRSVLKKCCSGVSLIAQRRRSEVSLGRASLVSLRYCRNVARIVAQAAVLLVACGSVVSLKVVFRVSLRSAAQCCPAVLFRGVAQKCRSKASLTCVCVFAQKCFSEVLVRSIGQKCCSELSIKGGHQQCRIRSVAHKCCSEVSL